MMTACSETEVLDQTAYQQNADQVGGIKFDVYAQRGITRGGGQYGDLDNTNIGKNGFGVFAYYTAGEQYSNSAKPNFMYNQQVTTSESPATGNTIWKYEPVKYWPNEYGSAAVSDDIDYLTFFAYAPWTEFEPTTGELIVPATLTDKDSIEHYQKYNIISVNKNTATGDPIIKYVVDTDPATSVDLLWGVAAEEGDAVAQGIAQGIESLAGGCRDDAALIAHILIEVDHHVLQSALIVVEQVVLVEHQHHRYAVGLGRGEEAVDEGGGSLGIVDRDQEEGLVYIGGDDMAGP